MALRPGLQRLDLTVLKNKAANDPAQVPAAASVTVHRQGATCESTVTIPAYAEWLDPIAVSDVGAIRPLDTLTVFRAGAQQAGSLTVTGVPGLAQLLLANPTGQPIGLQPGDRFVVAAPLPAVYGNRRGAAGDAVANPFTTDAATGRGGVYVGLERFDDTVTPSGGTARLYADAAGERLEVINALDYPNLQDAVNAIPPGSGGLVWLPPGGYTPKTVPAFTPPLILPHDRKVHLLGAGIDATVLSYRFIDTTPEPPDLDLDLILVAGDYQTVEGLRLLGEASAGSGTGSGIRIQRNGGSPAYLHDVCIRDCHIDYPPGYGLRVDDQPLGGVTPFAVHCRFERVMVRHQRLATGAGIYVGGAGTTTQSFLGCWVSFCAGIGFEAHGTQGLVLRDCVVEKNADAHPQLLLDGCQNVLVSHSWFEDGGAYPMPYIRAQGTYWGLGIEHCTFRELVGHRVEGVELIGDGRSIRIAHCEFYAQGNSAQGHEASIAIAWPPSQSWDSPIEAVIEGGTFHDGQGATREVRVQDGALRTAFVNLGGRMRLPQLRDAELPNVADARQGDMAFSFERKKVLVFDGTSWRELAWS